MVVAGFSRPKSPPQGGHCLSILQRTLGTLSAKPAGTFILEPECLRSIKPNQQNPDSISSILRGLGASDTCYVVSESSFDGQEMELLAALREIVGYGMATVVSCLPGRLGYFEEN